MTAMSRVMMETITLVGTLLCLIAAPAEACPAGLPRLACSDLLPRHAITSNSNNNPYQCSDRQPGACSVKAGSNPRRFSYYQKQRDDRTFTMTVEPQSYDSNLEKRLQGGPGSAKIKIDLSGSKPVKHYACGVSDKDGYKVGHFDQLGQAALPGNTNTPKQSPRHTIFTGRCFINAEHKTRSGNAVLNSASGGTYTPFEANYAFHFLWAPTGTKGYDKVYTSGDLLLRCTLVVDYSTFYVVEAKITDTRSNCDWSGGYSEWNDTDCTSPTCKDSDAPSRFRYQLPGPNHTNCQLKPIVRRERCNCIKPTTSPPTTSPPTTAMPTTTKPAATTQTAATTQLPTTRQPAATTQPALTILPDATATTTTTLMPAVVDEVDVSGCGELKECHLKPDRCTGGNCDFVYMYGVDGDKLILEMAGRASGWLAIGFNVERKMGGADAIGCSVDQGGVVSIKDSYNVGRSSNNLYSPARSVISGQGTFVNGRIWCKVVWRLDGQDYHKVDVKNNATFAIYGHSNSVSRSNEGLPKHDGTPAISSESRKVDTVVKGRLSGGSRPGAMSAGLIVGFITATLLRCLAGN